jgi:hypothetical protein
LLFSRFLFGYVVLSISLAFCRILEWKLPFQRYCNILELEPLIFIHFPWCLQQFGAQTFHVGWYFATRGHLGFVYVCFKAYLGFV